MNFTVRFTRRWVVATSILLGGVMAALFMTGAAQTLIERADKGPASTKVVAPVSGVGVSVRATFGNSSPSYKGLGMIAAYVASMALLLALWPVATRWIRAFNETRALMREHSYKHPHPVQRY